MFMYTEDYEFDFWFDLSILAVFLLVLVLYTYTYFNTPPALASRTIIVNGEPAIVLVQPYYGWYHPYGWYYYSYHAPYYGGSPRYSSYHTTNVTVNKTVNKTVIKSTPAPKATVAPIQRSATPKISSFKGAPRASFRRR